jgi:phage-related protein
MRTHERKPVVWIASSRKDLMEFPDVVLDVFGQGLLDAQCGDVHPDAKPLKGFGDASVMEIVFNGFDGAFRTVYTVKFEEVVYVLHAFQKKSNVGAKTPVREIEKIKKRLQFAKDHHKRWIQENQKTRKIKG